MAVSVPLTNDNYFDDQHYMSVSAWKKYNKCENMGLKGFDDSKKSVALLVGSYVDAYVEGDLEKFKEENPEIFSSRGATKGQLKSDYKQADEICKYIDDDKKIQQFLGGEKQVIMTGEIAGVPFKIKMDAYHPDKAIVDLKVMRTVTDKLGNFYDFLTPWGYDVQLACYQEIVYQNTGVKLPCYIVAVTKEDPINSVIIQVPQEVLDRALYGVESTVKRYYDVKVGSSEPEGCGTCPACVEKRTETPLISMSELLDFQ